LLSDMAWLCVTIQSEIQDRASSYVPLELGERFMERTEFYRVEVLFNKYNLESATPQLLDYVS
jgi:hypothetical protein